MRMNRSVKPSVSKIIILALLLVSGVAAKSAPAQTTEIYDARVFNWLFYVNTYADLLRAGISDEAKAKDHWKHFGLNEGRQAHPLFHSKQYLDNYIDLRNLYGATSYNSAISHYLQWGFSEKRRGYTEGGAYGRYTARNDIISVSTTWRTAGAIDSVVFKNREFINSYDHGRQLQYALSTNDQDESFNPTEAGSCDDDIGAYTSSVLDYVHVSGATMATQTMPAFWRKPNVPCGFAGKAPAVNTKSVSDYRMNKRVQVGYAGLPHAIQFSFQLYVPENVKKITLEAPTGYLTGDFTSFYTYQPATSKLTAFPANTENGLQDLPLIVATPDGAYAMGCYAPDAPEPAGTSIIYGHFPLKNYTFSTPVQSTTKWNIYVRTGPVAAATTLNFRTFVIAGTLDDVKSTMTQLYLKKQAGTL
jgi:hypothetical protein